MKSRTGVVVALLAALVGGLAFSNPILPSATPQDPVAERIDKLEADLAAAKLRMEALTNELAESKKKMDATVKYVDAQARAAAEMMEALDQSEREGFTYGINPNSRHTLLRGWREMLAVAQENVPEVEAPPPPAPPTGKRTRKP